MSRRLYLGRLNADAQSSDVNELFAGYGKIIDCRVMTGSSNRNGPPDDALNKPATGFGFVEFETAKASLRCLFFLFSDAEDAVTNFNGKQFMGQTIVVEFAKESRPRREPYEGGERSHGPPGIRLIVSGISRDTSWQVWLSSVLSSRGVRFLLLARLSMVPEEALSRSWSRSLYGALVVLLSSGGRILFPAGENGHGLVSFSWIPNHLPRDLKDFGREAGSVSFADIDRDFRDQGILEYLSRDDAERAVKDLDGKDLRGRPVRVALDDSRAGPDNYHRSDRRDDRPPRDDRYERSSSYRDDRGSHRDDRGSYRDDRSSYRRDRSRSPARRTDYEDRDRRPARSPPPRRDDDRRPAGYDDYRGGRSDGRRSPDYYYDRRRDRDDKRRDEKEDRFDDRPPRNGDAGWTR
ncbi:hypothetical protein B0H17DRAFT_1138206 [Mycena rosella]|uniref:RRM domain-containing protein n=1 Tax=Mycena rosella TaxID=1033263 RepID=A0AAD7D8B1_MYCRO|nr:hypothetical protein B0H17DRAFT_1138206 [Mycena rosella]